MENTDELIELTREVRNFLEYMSALGVETLPVVQVQAPVIPTPG